MASAEYAINPRAIGQQ